MTDCTCTFDEHGHIAVYCNCCGPRRTPEPRGIVEKRQVLGWECFCADAWTGKRLSRLRRHRSEIECQPPDAVEAFKQANGLKDDAHARALRFIESFHPREEGER